MEPTGSQYASQTPASTVAPNIGWLQMRLYFSGFPFWAIGLGILGIILLFSNPPVGILMVLIGGGWIVLRNALSPKDAEYDAWVRSRLHVSKDYALEQLRIDRTQLIAQEPFVIHGFVTPSDLYYEPYKSQYNPSEVRMRRGLNGKYRFSISTLTYIFPLENELAAFTGAVSALHPNTRAEVGRTYFYSDIVGITTDRKQNKVQLRSFAPAIGCAAAVIIIPLLLILGASALATSILGRFNSTGTGTDFGTPQVTTTSSPLSGLSGAFLPILLIGLIGVIVWFLFFRKWDFQSQSFNVEVNSGSLFGAVVAFISIPRPLPFSNTSEQEVATISDNNFPQTIQQIRFLLRSKKLQQR